MPAYRSTAYLPWRFFDECWYEDRRVGSGFESKVEVEVEVETGFEFEFESEKGWFL